MNETCHLCGEPIHGLHIHPSPSRVHHHSNLAITTAPAAEAPMDAGA